MMNGVLNVLITAGGTSERIDEVRRITNSGTGRLGALVAEGFLSCGRKCRVVYVCSEGAARPCAGDGAWGGAGGLEVAVADDVRAVKAAVEQVCEETAFDIIVHSMAISDYFVRAVSDAGLMAEAVAAQGRGDLEAVRRVLLSPPAVRGSKISSDKENLVVVLERAPKVISLLRGLAPSAVIVGFKLLAGVSEEELAHVGHGLLAKNDCDFVLANDMRTIREGRHEGLLISRDGSFERAQGKEGIAGLIVRRSLEGVRATF